MYIHTAYQLNIHAEFPPEIEVGRIVRKAHAWLRCGPLYVAGGAGHRHFGTVGIFG